MQFDTQRIAIHERSYLELMDLALLVVRAHAGPLIATSLLGAAPMIALNLWLLGGEPVESLLSYEPASETGPFVAFLMGYLFWLAALIVLEIPLATALSTLYLGKAVFQDRPPAREIARDFFAALPQLFLFQVLLRGLMIPWVITWALLFGSWPYLSEIMLLERTTLRKGPDGQSTYSRSRKMHGTYGADLFGRWMLATVVGVVWVLTLWLVVWFLRGHLTNQWTFDWAMYAVYLQLVIWFVVSYFTVVRFLSYLDLRIRSEGWEVALRLRAEAARLARQWT